VCGVRCAVCCVVQVLGAAVATVVYYTTKKDMKDICSHCADTPATDTSKKRTSTFSGGAFQEEPNPADRSHLLGTDLEAPVHSPDDTVLATELASSASKEQEVAAAVRHDPIVTGTRVRSPPRARQQPRTARPGSPSRNSAQPESSLLPVSPNHPPPATATTAP